MLIIPAIDLKDGSVVRLRQGRFDRGLKAYSDDPVKIALQWQEQGALLIHVVDLDGASLGRPKNLAVVKDILASVHTPIEFGGGVRSLETIKELLSLGVARVVLGTKAVEDSEFLEEAFMKFKDTIIVSVDAKSGHILTKGWQSSVESVQVLEFAQRLKKIGFSRMIYTDITKDGMLKGPNFEDVAKLLKKVKIGIIASGGVSSEADITRFKTMEKDGLQGVIVGKALYEGKFTLLQALQLSKGRVP